MSLADTLRRLLSIREPTKEDLKMAATEMDYYMRQRGGSPLARTTRRRFKIKRRRKDKPGEVRTIATVKVIDDEKN